MSVIWRQWIDGFDSTTAETSCTIDVDSAAEGFDKNKITSTIASASDSSDRATASETTLASLPQNDEGRIRFKFRTPATFDLLGNSTILIVRNPDPVSIIDLFINSSQVLGCFSAGGTLRSTTVVQNGTTVLNADTEYTIEVAWKGMTDGTSDRKVWLNDVIEMASIPPLAMVAANDCDTSEIRLGIDHYDGADSSGWEAKIRMAQLSDDASEILTDPTTIVGASKIIVRTGMRW